MSESALLGLSLITRIDAFIWGERERNSHTLADFTIPVTNSNHPNKSPGVSLIKITNLPTRLLPLWTRLLTRLLAHVNGGLLCEGSHRMHVVKQYDDAHHHSETEEGRLPTLQPLPVRTAGMEGVRV